MDSWYCPFLTFVFSRQNGITHVFVSEFDSEEDRQYYLEEDPAHLAFVKDIAGIVGKGQVVDFTPGVFLRARHRHSVG